jgi:ABC-2 type transport system permease protein
VLSRKNQSNSRNHNFLNETISIDGKIIGTSLAGLLQFLIWAIIGMSLLLQLRHFRVNVGPTGFARNDANCTARNDGTAQMYIKELWNLPYRSILIGFVIYFIGGYFL